MRPEALDLSKYLKAGDRIVFGQACGEPTTLVEALIAQGKDIGGLGAFIATSFPSLSQAVVRVISIACLFGCTRMLSWRLSVSLTGLPVFCANRAA